jgi:hypothetical protein
VKSYKHPSFQDRVDRAAEAKKKALEQLRLRPPLNPAIAAERKAASLKREATQADKAAAKKASKQAEIEMAAAADAAARAAIPVPPTEAERKAARDARYAARKNRR